VAASPAVTVIDLTADPATDAGDRPVLEPSERAP
jgi:hypothetical protein